MSAQMLTAQLQVCLRDDVQNFGNFQFTSQPADGFTSTKCCKAQQRAQIGNHIYTVIPLTFALTAVKSGTLSLGPFTASATLLLPSSNDQGGDPFFRQFFNQGEQKQISLATEMVERRITAVAGTENKPANFSGAVGDFTMTASVGPTNVDRRRSRDRACADFRARRAGCINCPANRPEQFQNFPAHGKN